MNGHEKIELLLAELFQADELRRFLSKLENAKRLTDGLPGKDVPYATLVHEASGLLKRHGSINNSFFRLLSLERPLQSVRIQTCWREVCLPHLIEENQDCSGRRLAVVRGLQAILITALVGGGIVFGARHLLLMQLQKDASKNVPIKISACTILCNDCPGIAGAWVFLPGGKELVVEVHGSRLIFECPPEGTSATVVVAVASGTPAIRYLSAPVILGGGTTTIEADRLADGLPQGIAIIDGVPRSMIGVSSTDFETDSPPSSPPLEDMYFEPVQLDTYRRMEEGVSEHEPPQKSPSMAASVDCNAVRRRTLEAKDRGAWKRVIQLTGNSCWKGFPQALELRVYALKEFGDFPNCIKYGEASPSIKVQSYVDFCKKRLARE